MTKYLTIAFHANLLFTFIGYAFQNDIITYMGYVLVLPILFLLYGNYRKWQFNKIDKVMYAAFTFGFLSDLITYAILGDLAIIIQISCSLLANLLFFFIFRLESSYIIFSKTPSKVDAPILRNFAKKQEQAQAVEVAAPKSG